MKKQSGIYVAVLACTAMAQGAAAFEAEEATIAGMQSAIRAGEVTCKGVVEAHLARARAYNGVCTALITADGASIKPGKGYLRASKALEFPTRTVAASRIFPDLDKYQGLPLELGRMEKSISDPSVWQQQGMRVGIANAGQLNALETLNVRGERSVTCKGKFDTHPSQGPLPAGAPAVCEKFRQQPDALERAAELDAQYGSNPDLARLPMYCVIASFKDPYDTKDMRTTSNNDVNFAMDVPPTDSTLVAQLRAKGAIIYAKSVAHEFNGGPGDPGGSNKAKFNWVAGGQMTSGWSGQPCNPYDTERVVRGSSGGSGAAVGGNLAMIGICEQSGASCQGPASRNGTAMILTTKGIIPDNGGIGNQWFNDRAGIHARTLVDAAKVLDAMKDPERGYHDPRDPFTALPKALIPAEPYASFLVGEEAVKGGKPLKGMRIAILREHMATPTKNHEAISAQVDAEIKKVLRDQLGAELVETVTPKYPDDPSVENIAYGFQDALAELLPRFMPEVFTRRDKDGTLFFDVPGHDVTSYDYLMKVANRKAPLTSKVDITNFANFAQTPCMTGLCSDTVFDLDRYLLARGDSRITNWAAWVGNAKFKTDESAAGARNWVDFKDHNAPGKAERLARSQIGRMALQRVMNENRIDAFVHAENTVPTPKIQGPNVGTNSLDGITPFFQIPRIVIPAGVTTVVYEPVYALNADRTDYISVLPDNVQAGKLPKPMPIAITLFSGQGEESTLIRIGSAYEAATHHRFAPPDFGPVKR